MQALFGKAWHCQWQEGDGTTSTCVGGPMRCIAWHVRAVCISTHPVLFTNSELVMRLST